METTNVSELVERLGSDEDAVRKMAVFKLQNNIGDPSFADTFIVEGGLTRLRYLTLHATGNTLAYSLTSFARLLEVDKGWECVDGELIERVSWRGMFRVRCMMCAGVFFYSLFSLLGSLFFPPKFHPKPSRIGVAPIWLFWGLFALLAFKMLVVVVVDSDGCLLTCVTLSIALDFRSSS